MMAGDRIRRVIELGEEARRHVNDPDGGEYYRLTAELARQLDAISPSDWLEWATARSVKGIGMSEYWYAEVYVGEDDHERGRDVIPQWTRTIVSAQDRDSAKAKVLAILGAPEADLRLLVQAEPSHFEKPWVKVV
jgi:hypothetical protein